MHWPRASPRAPAAEPSRTPASRAAVVDTAVTTAVNVPEAAVAPTVRKQVLQLIDTLVERETLKKRSTKGG